MFSNDASQQYIIHNIATGQTQTFKNENELIFFIARAFRKRMWYYFNPDADLYLREELNRLDNPYFNEGVFKNRYVITDKYGTLLNIAYLREKALYARDKLLEQGWKGENQLTVLYLPFKKEKRFYHSFVYRKTPVPYTRKIRGGRRYGSSPRTKHIFMMYDNPEYKEFNRGSPKLIPKWWDDKARCYQRSWKEQSKCRHQWEKKRVKNDLKN